MDRPHPNLADPDYEPTDEELAGLMKRAFAGLAEENARRLEYMRREIIAARDEALARHAHQLKRRP